MYRPETPTASRRAHPRGFTLIELMVVVAIIGVLAAVAIPKFLEYMKKGKRVEAEVHLVAIARAAEAGFIENAAFPQVASVLTPAQRCCDQPGKKCAVAQADWVSANPANPSAWDVLGFEMTQPFLFQYQYTSAVATEYEAIAVGDLDCDGTAVTYRMLGDASTGSPSSSMTRPARAD